MAGTIFVEFTDMEVAEALIAKEDHDRTTKALIANLTENQRLRSTIATITNYTFIWEAMDNVSDMDTTMDDYARAVSKAQIKAIGEAGQ